MKGAVDVLVVGKFAGAEDVSAVSTGSQIMMTITGFMSSMSMGITIFLGQKIVTQSFLRTLYDGFGPR